MSNASQVTMSDASPQTVVLSIDKPCKHSVRYGTADPKAPLSTLYLSRKAFAKMPQTITVTIVAGDTTRLPQ